MASILDKAKSLYTDYKWLDGPTGVEAADKVIHWGAISAGSLLSWVSTKLNPPGGAAKALEILNIAADIFSDPNIEGIPIKSEGQRTSRDIDVSKQMVITQDSSGTGSKEWITDNAAPHPRTWTIRGYITSMSNVIDGLLIIKPTLLLQLHLLDYYAASRRPVWFKAHYSLFYRVLVEHFDYDFDPKIQNAIPVNLTLCEFMSNQGQLSKAGNSSGERVQDAGKMPEGASGLDGMAR